MPAPSGGGLFAAMSSPVSHSGELDSSPQARPSPLRELFSLAWPTVLTMTSYTAMQFVDALMVSRVGSLELAAQGNGGLATFTPLSFLMGVLTMVNTYVSQNLGAGRPRQAPRFAWAALWMSAFGWALLLPYAFSMRLIFSRLGHSAELVELETQYGQILMFGCFLILMSRGLNHFFYGLHRPKVVFVATITGNVINVFGNWVLIFGHLGAPKLGIEGAAIATVIGTAVELLIPLAMFLGSKMHAELGTRDAWRPDWRAMRQLWSVGWPRGLTFGNEMVCWSVFMIYLIGTFGEAHNAAGWIALRYMHLSFMPAVGISVAVTALVGRYIGAGQPDIANQRAWLGVRCAMLYMGTCALIFVLFRGPLAGVLIKDTDPNAEQILSIATKLLICAAVFQLFDALAITLSGALSGAGDTVWPGMATMITSWTFIVGGGFAFVTWWRELESLGPWIGAAAFIIALGVAFLWRWTSGRWRSIRLLDPAADEAALTGGETVAVPDVDPASGPLADRVMATSARREAPGDEGDEIERETTVAGSP